jgi:hypothetical protein
MGDFRWEGCQADMMIVIFGVLLISFPRGMADGWSVQGVVYVTPFRKTGTACR